MTDPQKDEKAEQDLEELGLSEVTEDILSGMDDLPDGAYFAIMHELEGDW